MEDQRMFSIEHTMPLISKFLEGRRRVIRDNFKHKWDKFAEFMQTASREDALSQLLSLDGVQGNEKAKQFKLWLQSAGKSKQAVEGYITGIRSFMRYCRRIGAIDWTLTYAACGRPRRVLADLVPLDLAPLEKLEGDSLEAKTARLILQALATARTENTRRTYRQAFQHFALFLKKPSVHSALAHLLLQRRGEANSIALDYQAWMTQQRLSGATINVRLAALRSLVYHAYLNGLVEWKLEVRGPRLESYADLSGPSHEKIAGVLASLEANDHAISKRDRAIILMLYGLGLRASEVRNLDFRHLDFQRERVSIKGKARDKREWLSLPPQVAEAIKDWLRHRGMEDGPLFTGFKEGGRIARESIWRITTGYGLGRPHGLRHTGITRALDLTNGNYRKVKLFSRHKRVDTILRYDDNRLDLGGEVASAVSADIAGEAARIEVPAARQAIGGFKMVWDSTRRESI
jgi:integrase/recombinase XerC